jgi:hypothetical protein
MNLRHSIIGAVLAGASLVGVASMASSVAHAESPATTDTEVGASAHAPLQFWIENLSSETLEVRDVLSMNERAISLFNDYGQPAEGNTSLCPETRISRAPLRPGERREVKVDASCGPVTLGLYVRLTSDTSVDDILMWQYGEPGGPPWSAARSTAHHIVTKGKNITIRDK